MFTPRKRLSRGNFMRSHLRVAATSRTWRQPSSPRSRKQESQGFFSVKNIPVTFTLTAGGHSVATTATVVAQGVTKFPPLQRLSHNESYASGSGRHHRCHICFLPVTNSPPLTIYCCYCVCAADARFVCDS